MQAFYADLLRGGHLSDRDVAISTEAFMYGMDMRTNEFEKCKRMHTSGLKDVLDSVGQINEKELRIIAKSYFAGAALTTYL